MKSDFAYPNLFKLLNLTNSVLKTGKLKHKIGLIQTIKKLLFCLHFAFLYLGFPDSSAKSKQKSSFFIV
jgi:hypothetical protein